jgi:MmyB-like transcription regulator ligand binding domain
MENCQYFRQLWSCHDVQQHAMSPVRMRHPRVGDLELYREKLIVAGTDGLVLVMYHAEPGSPSAGRLASLKDLLVA